MRMRRAPVFSVVKTQDAFRTLHRNGQVCASTCPSTLFFRVLNLRIRLDACARIVSLNSVPGMPARLLRRNKFI